MVYGAVHKLHVPLEFTKEFEDVSDICMVIIDIVLTTKLVPFFNVNIILRLGRIPPRSSHDFVNDVPRNSLVL